MRDAERRLRRAARPTPKPTYERWQWGVVARRADRPGPGAVLRLVRGEPAGSRRQRRSSARSRARRRRWSQRLRALRRASSPARSARSCCSPRRRSSRGQGQQARGHLQLAQRDRHPRLRRTGRQQQLPDRRERPQPRRLGAGQVADRRGAQLPERGLPLVPALPLESDAGEPRHHRRELLRA